jgi:hypothetical protein
MSLEKIPETESNSMLKVFFSRDPRSKESCEIYQKPQSRSSVIARLPLTMKAETLMISS